MGVIGDIGDIGVMGDVGDLKSEPPIIAATLELDRLRRCFVAGGGGGGANTQFISLRLDRVDSAWKSRLKLWS